MRKVFFLLVVCCAVATAFATKPPLLIVGTDSVSQDEFRYLWKKHNSYRIEGRKDNIQEFLDSYINYRLKVLDAKEKGRDKRSEFLNEYEQYADAQLTPYMIDSLERDSVYHAAYERMKYEINASHILFKVANPAEDSVVYKKALEVREQIRKGEPFDSVARRASEDPSAQYNGGNLGWFGAFTMVYPFEVAAFNTPIDSISMPVRSSFGYHLIQVHAKRPTRGKMQVSHILRKAPQPPSSEREREIQDTLLMLRNRALAGESFSELAKTFSKDSISALLGGYFPIVSVGTASPQLINALFALEKDGDISMPIRLRDGWHIFQRDTLMLLDSYENTLEDIKSSLQRAGIEYEGHDALVAKMLTYLQANKDDNVALTLRPDDSIQLRTPRRVFATVGERELTLADLKNYMIDNKVSFTTENAYHAARRLYEAEAYAQCEAEIRRKNPTVGFLLNEFYNGLLLFDISEQRLWRLDPTQEKAFKKLYKKHKKEFRFTECLTTEEYSTSLKRIENLEALHSKLCASPKEKVKKRFLKKEKISRHIANFEANTAYFANYGKDATTVTNGGLVWSGNCSNISKQGKRAFFFRVKSAKKDVQKTFEESKGDLQRIFQTEEEARWLEELHNRYKVTIDSAQLQQVEKE